MQTVTLQQPELVEQLNQFATEQGSTTETLLTKAIVEYLDRIIHQKIHQEVKAFETMHADLVLLYHGKYIAMHHKKVVDSGRDARQLYLRVRQKYGYVPILIRQVREQPKQTLVFRSPRFVRNIHEPSLQ